MPPKIDYIRAPENGPKEVEAMDSARRRLTISKWPESPRPVGGPNPKAARWRRRLGETQPVRRRTSPSNKETVPPVARRIANKSRALRRTASPRIRQRHRHCVAVGPLHRAIK